MAASSGILAILMCVLLSFVEKVALDLKVSVPQCCQLGINWQNEGLKCHDYPTPVLDVPPADQELCLRVLEMCCDTHKKHNQCQKGMTAFKTENKCSAAAGPNSCDNFEKNCCDSCQLGRRLGEDKVTCSAINIPVEEELRSVMQSCCAEVNPPAKLGKKPKKTDNNQSTVQEPPDYDNYEEYGVPTPVPDNLCDLLPGQLCAQICVPTHGSYYCKCEEGYVLMEDQKTCQKNTSLPTKQKPVVPQIIVPNPEKPVPLHKPKEKPLSRYNPPTTVSPPKRKTCEEFNPCEQECTNTKSGFECGCRAGYTIDVNGKTCKDVNECLNDTFVCDSKSEECVNEIGGYRCEKIGKVVTTSVKIDPTTASTSPVAASTPKPSLLSLPSPDGCAVGFEKISGQCTDVDECDSNKYPEVCDPDHVCLNTPGSFECRCRPGFQENPSTHKCEDINECQTTLHNCLASQRCDNTIGSFQCIRFTGCGTGYTLNSQNGQCEDDDECALRTDNCRFLGPNFICRNTLGSFRCERKRCLPGDNTCDPNKQCPPGYVQNESGNCVDLNECTTGTHNCHPYADICVNRVGGFECRKVVHCPKGFEATANGCMDVDECATNKHTCKGLAECKNEKGGYACLCPTGYQLAADNSCQDINECSFYMCPYNSRCVNTPGSYRCDCNVGFKNIDDTTCQDIDECSDTPGICQHTCMNVFGSFRCTCKTGFKLHANNRTCEDLNECDMYKDQRLCIGDCVNIPGSFTCKCPPGYVLGPDGSSCQDIDECARNPCRGEDEICLNTRGGFKCNSIKCPPNYVKEHKNRCKRLKSYCRKDDVDCLQQPLTYSFNFITFVSMLPIPPKGYLDLFTMRGPLWSGMDSQFTLELLSTRPAQTITPATKDYFRLRDSGRNQRVISLVRPIPGPQEIELQLTMKLYDSGVFMGLGVAKLMIHVSEFEF